MEQIKQILRPVYIWIVGSTLVKSIKLIDNFIFDFRQYISCSTTFSKKHLKNKEADLILEYHSLEKGMLFVNMKNGFAKRRVINMHKLLLDNEVRQNINRSQILVAYQVMCKYYELHLEKGFDISDFYCVEQYTNYKNALNEFYRSDFLAVRSWEKEIFYKNVKDLGFNKFAYSRQSIRSFTGEKIKLDYIKKAVSIANTAPSVCNRQASNVYLIEDKLKIDKLLKVQGGFEGYSEKVKQLLIVTNDRRYYYTVGERNQFYIDGGIYLLNLLYSLHFLEIACCPANWGKTRKDEKRIEPIIDIPKSEKIICMIPIGIATDTFRTTLSKRRPVNENLIIVN